MKLGKEDVKGKDEMLNMGFKNYSCLGSNMTRL
jgi:hypothetical protein